MLEASEVHGASHILLMDDDAITEPESVLRTAAFLALARTEIAIGGQMLDALRPTVLSEFSARMAPENLSVRTLIGRRDLAKTEEGLAPLLRVQATGYNAWWFLAFPVSALKRAGLPLPFFIHYDDVEFGHRLALTGVPTVPVPGIGVWHEPTYLKQRGWTAYYDYRNALVTFALHLDISGRFLFRRVVVQLLVRLLSLDYFAAWGLCEALRDYRRGPAILEGDARQVHRRIIAARLKMNVETVSRAELLNVPTKRSKVRRPSWNRLKLLSAFLGQLLRPSSPAHRRTGGCVAPEK